MAKGYVCTVGAGMGVAMKCLTLGRISKLLNSSRKVMMLVAMVIPVLHLQFFCRHQVQDKAYELIVLFSSCLRAHLKSLVKRKTFFCLFEDIQ